MTDMMLFFEQGELHKRKDALVNLIGFTGVRSSKEYQKYTHQQGELGDELNRRGVDLGRVCRFIHSHEKLPPPKYPDIVIEFSSCQNDVTYLYGNVASALIGHGLDNSEINTFIGKQYDLRVPMLWVTLV